MALSGSVSVEATPNGRDLLVFSWEAVQDAVAKTSTISWVLQLVADASGALNVTDAEIYPWAVTIDGQAFSGKSNIYIQANQTKTLATGSAVLSHDADGTKSFDFSFMQNFGGLVWGGSTVINDVTGSGVGVLDSFAKMFPLKEWITGIILERLSRTSRTPVAYLYNGVRLPALPEWDREAYPFAVITQNGYITRLWFTEKQMSAIYKNNELHGVYIPDEIAYEEYRYKSATNEWYLYRAEIYNSSGGYIFFPIWTNVDMLRKNQIPDTSPVEYEDTTLIGLEATEPIPVYE